MVNDDTTICGGQKTVEGQIIEPEARALVQFFFYFKSFAEK